MKVVSIFGNTGDGKSYTLNHTLFAGRQIFSTSSSQVQGTAGIWAAYEPTFNVIAVDTEGLLGISLNDNQRKRLLLKVLAISDVVIYRTRAERLHSDMFEFLGNASKAFLHHFRTEIDNAAKQMNIPVNVIGPAVVIFHETQHTDIISKGK